MPETIFATGVVGTPPELTVVGNGLARLTFRLASTQRKYNRATSEWENGETNWYSVVAFRRLAEHTRDSVSKLDRVIVVGRLKVSRWEKDDKRGTNVEIIADAIGHDLTFGTASFSKAVSATPQASGDAPTGPGDAGDAHEPETPSVDGVGWALPGGAGGDGQPTMEPLRSSLPSDEESSLPADPDEAEPQPVFTGAVETPF
jgi:single-strand DNA-binding protein